jgi:glycosyltransferase involved in cell wall biosynthesis
LLPTLRREIAAADVVHAHGYLYQGTVASAAIGRRSKTPLVVTEHVGHVPYKSRLLNSFEAGAIATLGRGVLRSAAAVVTYNDRVADQLRELRPGIEPVTILNGVDQSLFRPPESGEREAIRSALGWDDRPRALFVGRPVAKKGFPAAVEAIRAQPSAVLAVAGTDSLPPDTPDRVEALGTLSRSRLAEVYRAADVLLSPARGEGFPLSLQEGLASGLPVLFADDPGYAPNLEGIGAGARAIGDGDHLAAALAELLADPAKLARARENAAGHARSRFSWPRAADAHEALYARVLDG